MSTDRTHGTLKVVAQLVLPLWGALYFLGGFAHAEEVVGGFMILIAFLNVILWISQKRFNNKRIAKGTIDLVETEEKMSFTLNLDDHPASLRDKKLAVFEVVKG